MNKKTLSVAATSVAMAIISGSVARHYNFSFEEWMGVSDAIILTGLCLAVAILALIAWIKIGQF